MWCIVEKLVQESLKVCTRLCSEIKPRTLLCLGVFRSYQNDIRKPEKWPSCPREMLPNIFMFFAEVLGCLTGCHLSTLLLTFYFPRPSGLVFVPNCAVVSLTTSPAGLHHRRIAEWGDSALECEFMYEYEFC